MVALQQYGLVPVCRAPGVPTAATGSSLLLPYTGIYGVGKAALHPPALAVLSHTPDGATQTIAWVGKGIVYDTGGLSIKGKVRCGSRCNSDWHVQAPSAFSIRSGRLFYLKSLLFYPTQLFPGLLRKWN